MNIQKLEATARQMVAPGKGILATDESSKTANKRLAMRNIPQTEDMRRAWREILFTAPGIENNSSGVILLDETIRQNTKDGIPFRELLSKRGIIPGIKVDKGLANLPNFPGEKITEGLDGLSARLEEYATLGAQFSKWRSVISIGQGLPTTPCLEANAFILAQYAARSQSAGLVPIIEPEVLIEGTHTLIQSEVTIRHALEIVFSAIAKYRIYLPGLILKTSMALPGKQSGIKSTPVEVAESTLRALTTTVPKEIAGVVFLSGGQTPQEATENLNAMANIPHPWPLTFSYSRAFQDPAMDIWMGQDANIQKAQETFAVRVSETALASEGKYK
ncbi:MAG: fructose-bisphosphate aldolase class I [Patescibacteria group bacterium]|nr:fructose-bisphosphate aldolase class I [Patescibacteria group bacterium]